MIHLVFQQADAATLQKVMVLDSSLAGEVLEIKDDYAVGPLQDIHTDQGLENRQEWWRQLIAASPYAAQNQVESIDDRKTVAAVCQRMEEEEHLEAWIWMAQNQHDVCGYFWLIGQLNKYAGRIVILYFNNLPFINEKGQIFYPVNLHDIQPKEFLKAKKLNRKVTLSEFEIDPDEWKKIASENTLVRMLEGGKKISGQDVTYYDKDIINGLTAEWQKGHRAMYHILMKMRIKTGDVFLFWRMKFLQEEGRIEVIGDVAKGWKEFEVRLKSNTPASIPAP